MSNSNENSTDNIEKRNQFIDMFLLDNIEFNISLNNKYTDSFYKYIAKIIHCMMSNDNELLQSPQLLELLQKSQYISEVLENTSAMLTELHAKVTEQKNPQDLDLQKFNDLIILDFSTSQSFNDFIKEYYITIKEINKNHLEIEEFMCDCANFAEFNFIQETDNIDDSTSFESELKENNAESTEIVDNTINEILENTLIISESSGKVILPYTLRDLDDTLKTSDNKFSNIQEIIDKNFTIPYTNYSNPIISRFKEAYNLARNKEKLSIMQSFNLGTELLFNYNLHPAIISACKNLDELDIYLDYLENGETDKFKIFDIRFEITPVVVK